MTKECKLQIREIHDVFSQSDILKSETCSRKRLHPAFGVLYLFLWLWYNGFCELCGGAFLGFYSDRAQTGSSYWRFFN